MKNAISILLLVLLFASSCTSQSALFDKSGLRKLEENQLSLVGKWKTEGTKEFFRFKLNSDGLLVAQIADKSHVASHFETVGDLDFIIKIGDSSDLTEWIGRFASYRREKIQMFESGIQNPSVMTLTRQPAEFSVVEE